MTGWCWIGVECVDGLLQGRCKLCVVTGLGVGEGPFEVDKGWVVGWCCSDRRNVHVFVPESRICFPREVAPRSLAFGILVLFAVADAGCGERVG